VMMTNGPKAKIGEIMEVEIQKNISRKSVLEHNRYYEYRERLLSFLEEQEHLKENSKKNKIIKLPQSNDMGPLSRLLNLGKKKTGKNVVNQ
jgi:hypothetical protein